MSADPNRARLILNGGETIALGRVQSASSIRTFGATAVNFEAGELGFDEGYLKLEPVCGSIGLARWQSERLINLGVPVGFLEWADRSVGEVLAFPNALLHLAPKEAAIVRAAVRLAQLMADK